MAEKLKLTFRIHYHTQWGESLYIVGFIHESGSNEKGNAIPMYWEGEGFWRVTLEVASNEEFRYHYLLRKNSGETLTEFGTRTFIPLPHQKTALVRDFWLPLANPHHPFFSTAFTSAVFKRLQAIPPSNKNSANVRLGIRAPRVPQHFHLCISGNTEALGNWNLAKPLLLSDTNFPNWTVDFFTDNSFVEYKYGLFDASKKVIVKWEEGQNRELHVSPNYDKTVQNDEVLRIFDEWRGAGVAIPVFSIRSQSSMGCGEFKDLVLLCDWAHAVGMKMIQILPINDTISTYTWRDSYPYNAISVNALHPIYLHINDLFQNIKAPLKKEIESKSIELNNLGHVDFEQVLKAKLYFARLAFRKDKQTFKAHQEYKTFSAKNKSWLLPYAYYSALRDKYGTSDFRMWGEKYVRYDGKALENEVSGNSEFSEQVDFYCFLQYHLDTQLAKAVQYTRDLGIIMKGDIPIGINRNGVEAWQEPHLFNFDQQAGAPPDDFAVNGQNWGFPTYNWQKMEAENYNWWTLRFQKMADYFDAYRIDHILGFFRIWEIPLAYKEGLMGHFNPALPLSKDELKSFGVDFDFDRFCKPFITRELIYQLFDVHAELILSTFFEPHEDRLQFTADFNTEEKVVSYIESLDTDNPIKHFKETVCLLHYEVLFVSDKKPEFYHPRITLFLTHSYTQLPAKQKEMLYHAYTNYYFHRHDDFWGVEGKKKLQKIVSSTDMLVCGEDLGMIPNCVEGVMDDLMILSLEVQRMPKKEGVMFGNPQEYPYLSVCTPATHDMSTLRGWWEETPEMSQLFYNEVLHKWGKAPPECDYALNTALVQNQLSARSLFAVLSIQDWLNCDESTISKSDSELERINIPKNPQHYWKYRMHVGLEDLLKNDGFKQNLIDLLVHSGRD